MKKSWLLLLFITWAWRGLAQPGPWGGELRFRLFDPHGRLVEPNRSDYRCFPSWQPATPEELRDRRRLGYDFAPAFRQEGRDGYRAYAAVPTPGGGIVPPDFAVNVVHGADTMRIYGLNAFGSEVLRVDSIPFSPGRFWVPAAYLPLLNVRVVGGRIVNSGWDFFRNPAGRPDRITTAPLAQSPLAERIPPDSLLTCPLLTVRYSERVRQARTYEPGRADVLRAAERGQRPKLLLGHLGQLTSVTCAGSRLLVQFTSRLVLKTEDGGATWRVFEVRDRITVPWHGYLASANELYITRVWADGDRVLARGSRNWGPSGFYELNFTQDTTSEVVRRSLALNRAAYLASLTAAEQEQKAVFLKEMRAEIAKSTNQVFVRRGLLRQAHFMQNNSYISPAAEWRGTTDSIDLKAYFIYRERPIVTLRDGKFQFIGSHWAKTVSEDSEIPACKVDGSCTVTDSTLTFRPRPGSKCLPPAPQYDFYPAGTYYYYFSDPFNSGQPLLILQRWNDEVGGTMYLAFRLRH
ncbi:hypothetical protein [Hymenobacter properus]|uniref:Uncharacterized protein n=1 Tax=Hymenobacter properus TaxID=2791026 RepID=A0A931FLF7_9BACT|nr:hypothetical protein [Hymenobacter properus]MBF9140654.1 hypothetical protein [Hymenobacter properus]MBR7719462.1 hypothetical protein [Microvirga sp. SRT04]